MMGRTIVFVPGEEAAALHWVQLGADDSVLAEGGLAPAEPAPDFAETSVIAVLPGETVTAAWLDTEGQTDAQRRAAARYALIARLALDPARAQTAVGEAGDDGRVLAAAVDTATLSAALRRLASHGLDPDIVTAEHLLLPGEPGHVRTYDLGQGRLAVRTDEEAFVAEEELARLILSGRPIAHRHDERSTKAALYAGSGHAFINLRVDGFARSQPLRLAGRVRWWALCAAAIPALLLIASLTDIYRTDMRAADIEAESRDLALAALPPGTDPARAVDSVLAGAAQQPDAASFTAVTAALFGALRTVPGARIETLDWSDNALSAELRLTGGTSAEALRPAIEGRRYRLVGGAVRPVPGGLATNVEISPQ